MDSHTAPTIDVSAFRMAMSSFPTGVTVVTVAYGDGDMHGVTVITGCPVLVGAAASFDCWLRQSYRAGDHLIVLGEVVALVHRPQLEPLIFHARTYKSLEA
jgi:flavin reductase (DIM6/NTAB) family NADH-FMN oxidoreductase RutF